MHGITSATLIIAALALILGAPVWVQGVVLALQASVITCQIRALLERR